MDRLGPCLHQGEWRAAQSGQRVPAVRSPDHPNWADHRTVQRNYAIGGKVRAYRGERRGLSPTRWGKKHSGIQITSDIYATIFAEVDREAAEAVVALVPARSPQTPRAGRLPTCAHLVPTG